MPARGLRKSSRKGGDLVEEEEVGGGRGGRGRSSRSKRATATVIDVTDDGHVQANVRSRSKRSRRTSHVEDIGVPEVVEEVLPVAQSHSKKKKRRVVIPSESEDSLPDDDDLKVLPVAQTHAKKKKRRVVIPSESEDSLPDDDDLIPSSSSLPVTSPEAVEDGVESPKEASLSSSIQRRSPLKSRAVRPAVSSSSVQGIGMGGFGMAAMFDGEDVDIYFYCVGHTSTNNPNEKGAFLAKRFGFCMNKRSLDTIPGGFGKYIPVALKGWGNVKHYSTSAQQVSAMVPGMLYKIKETKRTKFGLIKVVYAPTYAPHDFEIMLGDGCLAIPCSTPLKKDDMALTGRTGIAALGKKDHSYNSWYLARLGDKDVLQDNGASNALTRLVYDDSGSSCQLLIWDEECPLAIADSGSIVLFWAYVSQKDLHPKKLALISGGVLDLDSFDDQTGFMPIPAPPLIVEHKFLPCITEMNLVGYFQNRPMTGVRILHSIPFVLECLEDDMEYVDFLCPSCAKILSSDSISGGAVVHSCTSHGIIEVDKIDLVCHPLCRLSVRLGSTASSESIFVTSAKLAKGQEVIVFGHSCVDICKGADLLPYEGEKFMGTFFIAASGISVDNVRRVNVE